jgi:CDP-glycerol glycerophosphotransferase (TagB/SpsB family)
MTTPGLDVFQLKRSKKVKHYSFLQHSVTDAAQYRLFGLDHFDSILLNADYQIPYLRTLEKIRAQPEKQLIIVGCTYLDVFTQKMKGFPKEENHVFTILVSPSWGESGLLKRYGKELLDGLVKTDWRIIVRPHPQSKISEPQMLKKLTEQYKDQKNIEWDYNRENIYSLSKADIMISDFSGIIFDFILLFDKPIMYNNQKFDMRPYDSIQIEKELWQFEALRKIGIELKEEMFADIKNVIQSVYDDKKLQTARRQAKNEAWMYQGEAGKRVADFMIKTQEGLS